MKLHAPTCPECGQPAIGTVEHMKGWSEFVGTPGSDENVEFSGWTEIFWDAQKSALERDGEPEGPENRPLVICPEDHVWPTVIGW